MTDWFYDLLPMAITYGMSAKEFWEDDPDLFWAYRFSYFEKMKEKQNIFNNNAWLQGAYIYEAVSVAICNAFGKNRIEYTKKPYEFKENKGITEEEKRKAIQMNISDIKARISQVNAIRNGAVQQEVIKGENRV